MPCFFYMAAFVAYIESVCDCSICSIQCAVIWFGDLLSINFAHFMEVMVFGSRSFDLQISIQWSSLLVSIASGTLNAIMLKVLAWNLVLGPIFSHIFFWFSVFAVHVVAFSVVNSIVVLLFLVLMMDQILPDGSSSFVRILLSSDLSCRLLRCESFESFIPFNKKLSGFDSFFCSQFWVGMHWWVDQYQCISLVLLLWA